MQTRRLRLPKGARIFREGDAPDSVYFISSGQVAVQRGDGDGLRVLAVRGAGSCVGEMGVVRNTPRSADVVACTDVKAVRVAADVFRAAFAKPAGGGLSLMQLVRRRLEENDINP